MEDLDQEEEEEEEEDKEELTMTTAAAALLSVDLQHPSTKRVPEPTLEEKVLLHDSDAAVAFLHKQQQHNKTWQLSTIKAMDPTSRAVERIFSVVKEFLERNSLMRVEVLNSLVVLHDLSLEQQVNVWLAHHERDTEKGHRGESHLQGSRPGPLRQADGESWASPRQD
jgi:hypothetical protein